MNEPISGKPRATQTFGRSRRISNSDEFTRALRAPRRAAGRYFVVSHCMSNHATARLGIAIGRRVSPLANRRNRIKRALREAFRRRCAKLPAVDVVVLVRPACAMLPAGELEAVAARMFDDLVERCARL